MQVQAPEVLLDLLVVRVVGDRRLQPFREARNLLLPPGGSDERRAELERVSGGEGLVWEADELGEGGDGVEFVFEVGWAAFDEWLFGRGIGSEGS